MGEMTTNSKLVHDELTADSLSALLDGSLVVLQIPAFASAQECSDLARRACQLSFDSYEQVEPRINRVGITVFEFDRIGKQEYFDKVPEATGCRKEVVERFFDPVERVMDAFSKISDSPVAFAEEEGYGKYFAGLIRRIEEGTLVHIDFAPNEQPDWKVGQVESQLVWNLYVGLPDQNPGTISIWDRPWRASDESYKLPDSYGYDEAVIATAPSVEILPRLGDLVIINTRNFHRVSPTDGDRIAFTSAVGRLPDGEIIFWS